MNGEEIKKVNLGSAWMKLPGFTHIDLRKTDMTDLVGDMRNLSAFGIKDDQLEEIHSYYSLEHVPYFEVKAVLRGWFEKLSLGGRMETVVPDLNICITRMETDWDKANFDLFGEFDPAGYWSQPQDWHRSGFTEISLTKLLREAGFRSIKTLPSRGLPGYDCELRMEAYK